MQQPQQPQATTVQTGPTTVQAADTTVQTGPTTVQTEPTTLHDFTLGLLTDLDAREAFQQDPLGCLEAAGLGDITAGDVHEILPLVLDAASVPNVDALDVLGATDLPAVDHLQLIASNVDTVTGLAGNVTGLTGVAGITAPSAVTALVSDFSGLGDVSHTLDSSVLHGNEVVSTVSGVAHDNVQAVVGQAVDVADVHAVSDVLVKDLDTGSLVQNVDSDVLVKHVVDTVDVDVKDVVSHNVVQDVAQIGEVHHDLGQVIGDVKVGDLDLLDGGVGNHNHVDIHF